MSTTPYPADLMTCDVYNKANAILIDDSPYMQITLPHDEKCAMHTVKTFFEKNGPFPFGTKIVIVGAYKESSMSLPLFTAVVSAAIQYCFIIKEGDEVDIQFIFCVQKPTKGFEDERAFNSNLQLVAFPESASNQSFSPIMVLDMRGLMGVQIDIHHVTSDSVISLFRKMAKAQIAAHFFHPTTKHLVAIINKTTPVDKGEAFIQDYMKNAATIYVPAQPQSYEADFKRVVEVAAKYELKETIAGKNGDVNSLDGVVYPKPEDISDALNAMTRKLMDTTDIAAQKAAAQNLIIGYRFFNGDESLANGTYCEIRKARSLFIGDEKKKIGAYIFLGVAAYLHRLADGSQELLDFLTTLSYHEVHHEEAAIYERVGNDKKKIYVPDTSFGGDRILSRSFVLQVPKRFNADGTRAQDTKGKNAQHHAAEIVVRLLRGGSSYDPEYFHAICDRIDLPHDKRVLVSQKAVFTDLGSVLKSSAILNVDNVLFAARSAMEAAFDVVSGYEGEPLFPIKTPSPAKSGRSPSAPM